VKKKLLMPTMNDCFPATQFSRMIVLKGFCNGSAVLLSRVHIGSFVSYSG